MKKAYILLFAVVVFVGGVFALSSKDTKNEDALTYLNQADFDTIEFASLLDKTLNDSWWVSADDYMLESFTVSISADHEIRNIIGEVTRESLTGDKRYKIMYNVDADYFGGKDYFEVKEYEMAAGEDRGRLPAKEFLSQLDTLKANMAFPSGQHEYYTIDLLASSELMVYGEPVAKNDSPLFYSMK